MTNADTLKLQPSHPNSYLSKMNHGECIRASLNPFLRKYLEDLAPFSDY